MQSTAKCPTGLYRGPLQLLCCTDESTNRTKGALACIKKSRKLLLSLLTTRPEETPSSNSLASTSHLIEGGENESHREGPLLCHDSHCDHRRTALAPGGGHLPASGDAGLVEYPPALLLPDLGLHRRSRILRNAGGAVRPDWSEGMRALRSS